MSLREASLQSSQLADMYGQSAELIAQVVTDPNQTTTGNYSFIARAIYVHTGQLSYGMRIPIRVITPRATVLKLLPGKVLARLRESLKVKRGVLQH
ncbi:unannotated protein [freshwater metagenome]|uniref:Unannotated protein n=1 Tax=freshwater metagenome TaxID=449393 RepID=A0A6J7AK19_9ZZZZ